MENLNPMNKVALPRGVKLGNVMEVRGQVGMNKATIRKLPLPLHYLVHNQSER